MKIINVFSYGDFDIRVLHSTWVNENLDPKTSLRSLGLSDDMFKDICDPKVVTQVLRNLGFTNVGKISEITLGGGL